MLAYRIVDWMGLYEVTLKGHKAKKDTSMEELRSASLAYIRIVVHGHSLSASYRRMVKKASALGSMMEMSCFGLFIKLLEVAADQEREYRGWILDDRQRPVNAARIADLLDIYGGKVQELLEILMDDDVSWVELAELPVSLQNNKSELLDVNLGELPASPGNAGTLPDALPAQPGRFARTRYETETEDVTVTEVIAQEIFSESETRTCAREGNDGRGGDGENAGQPQARPQPPVSVSGSAPVTDSASKQLSDSAPASVPVSDSVSGAGGGPGAAGSGPASGQQRFEIIRECKIAVLELTQIIHPRNSSDMTTINDIFSQLQQRLISGSPHRLFELSLNTARQCWRGDNPIAMFVAAMKKPPFYYVPRKLSVVPGKFSRVKKTE